MIAENIQKIRERIAVAAARVSRDPAEITLVCVTKARSIEQIREVISSGLKYIGENRIQEALLKYNQLSAVDQQADIKWQMIGNLQSNKVRDALKVFDLIHSVDSIALAEEINKQAVKINKVQDILIEVKTSPEETKFGVGPESTLQLVCQVQQFKNIKIKGLMTIAPVVDHAEKARPYFRQLRELLNKVNKQLPDGDQLSTLSMGMSDDFQVAIEEGATIVRIGRAIFES